MILRSRSFHPLTVLLWGLAVGLLVGLWIDYSFVDAEREYMLYYYLPMAIPFVAFLFDRLERLAAPSLTQWVVDAGVLAWSLTRAFIPIPFASGHALFLTYALLTTRGWVPRLTAALVMLQVIYLKFAWRDVSLIGGIVLGCLAALLYRCKLIHAKQSS